ncbi:MAG: hypothetical protein E5299_02351 [Burkholderia gladioli]|nr:MAG: hypothetical protein E5299_02351 [Burkholderia gladioli]
MSVFGNKISKLSKIQKQGSAAAFPGERIEWKWHQLGGRAYQVS